MNDEEMVWTVVVLAAAYYFFIVRAKQRMNPRTLSGRRSTGRSGTVGGGASKAPGTWHNTNALTNAQQGGRYSPAPIARVGSGSGASPSNVGAPSGRRGTRSGTTSGIAGSFVSPQWPTRRVTSTGSRAIGTGTVSVPSYAAIPLTTTGPGGGGTWLH